MPGECGLIVEEVNHQELVNHPNATFRYDEIMGGFCDCPEDVKLFFRSL